MPIIINDTIQVMDQKQFGRIAYEVMQHVFAIHNEMGRFFEEHVYRNELMERLGDRARKEVWVYAEHNDFRKPYRVDLLVDGGALFELKAVPELHTRHRSQLIHYLLLTGLRHGKLINFRPGKVEHEFVNTALSDTDRRAFQVRTDQWHPHFPFCQRLKEVVLELLRDWGTSLDVQLYEEAITHFFGGPERVEQEVNVVCSGHHLGRQNVRLIHPTTALKITAFNRDLETFEAHVRRFLKHTELEHVAWVNVALGNVSFRLISM